MKKMQVFALLLTLCLVFVGCGSQGNSTFWIADVTAQAGQTVDVEIMINDSTGVAATDLEVDFPSDKLTFKSVATGEAFSAGRCEGDVTKTGTVHVVAITLEPPEQSGTVATLTFQVADGVTGEIPLTLRTTSCYDFNSTELEATCANGTITVK